MSPKVTIIIPVYNVEKYLRECMESAINQTLEDIQIICVNDGSSDGSGDILREYERNDDRITVIEKSNGGLSSARNAAYPFINGKYVAFLDSDDRMDFDTCKCSYEIAEKTGSDMLMFSYLQYGG